MYISGSAENNHHKASTAIRRRGRTTTSSTAPRQGRQLRAVRAEADVGRRQLRPERVGAAVRRRRRQVRRPGGRAPRRLLDVEQHVNEWNSVAKGPRLDLLRLHADAIRAKGLKLLVSLHHAYHFTGYYDHVPAQSDASLKKLYGQLGQRRRRTSSGTTSSRRSSTATSPTSSGRTSTCTRSHESQRLNFLSYYYNKAVAWNKDVVATYKDGFDNRGEVYDFERGGPAGHPVPVLADRRQHLQLQLVLHARHRLLLDQGDAALADRPGQQERQHAAQHRPDGRRHHPVGAADDPARHRRLPEAVRRVRSTPPGPGTAYGEGPTQMGGGSFTTPREGTNQDIRFTRSKDNTVLYATVLGWPGSTLNITTLASGPDQPEHPELGAAARRHRRLVHRPARAAPRTAPACTSRCRRPRRTAPRRTW